MAYIRPDELVEDTYYLITSPGSCKKMQSVLVAKFLNLGNDTQPIFYSTDMKCPIVYNTDIGWTFSKLNLIDKHSIITHKYFNPENLLDENIYEN
jgi:hypothetical protein